MVDALAQALRLNDSERRHLRELALGPGRPKVVPATVPDRALPEGVEWLMESMRPHPVYVVGRSFDLLAANPGGLALFAGLEEWPAERRNLARYVVHTRRPAICSVTGRTPYAPSWRGCEACAESSRTPPTWSPLIDELSDRRPEFARAWEKYDVVGDTRGRRLFHHPEVGDITLGFPGMTLNGTHGQFLVAFFAEPGTPDHDAMVLLDQLSAKERHGQTSSSPSPAPA
ncbi:transcriptional regulator [Streptomyces sp. NPDC020192]|uniref:MmyB family transcriptional regulator n=1 Tax=Streptomyces sp. NPDC020192 TaxID=3365066 RepID=UPI0037A5148F